MSHGYLSRSLTFALMLIAGAAVPGVAAAQTPAAKPLMASGITASIGAGFGVEYCCPDEPLGGLTGSVQIPLGTRWLVEGQFQMPKTAESTESWSVPPNFGRPYAESGTWHITDQKMSFGGSALYRFIAGRKVSAFAGAGVTYRIRDYAFDGTRTCEPVVPGACDNLFQPQLQGGWTDKYLIPQASAGFDYSISKLVTLFGAVRIDDAVTPMGGVRISLTTRPAEPLFAPDVRVRSTNGGDLRGRLVSLTATEVVIRQSGRNVVLPIGDVQRVEKVSHRIRNGLIGGAILGYVAGYFLSCGGGDEEDCWPEIGLIGAGIGTGVGALIGGIKNGSAAGDGRDVLYAGPGKTPARFQISPIVTPKRAGFGMLVRW